MKGVTIGSRSVVANGSVVIKDVPSDVIAGGNPASVLKMIGP
jgi:acetyltransferase-like isoleucine patch superfamily enzyme